MTTDLFPAAPQLLHVLHTGGAAHTLIPAAAKRRRRQILSNILKSEVKKEDVGGSGTRRR